jgi:hypothetical protein
MTALTTGLGQERANGHKEVELDSPEATGARGQNPALGK